MGKTLNVKQIVQQVFQEVEGMPKEMVDCLGNIEDTFTCIIYGESGHGKTNMTVQVLKALKSLGSMLYISWEEGHGRSIQDLVLRHNLDQELPQLSFSDGETIDELMVTLGKKQSAKVVVLDTWQYSQYTFKDYMRLKEAFVMGKTAGRRKVIIIISHVKGKEPHGTAAIQVKRDCNIKIHVDHYVGFIVSRFSGSIKNYLIYEAGAKKYYGKDLNKTLWKVAPPKEVKNKEPPPPSPEGVKGKQRAKKTVVKVLPEETKEEQEMELLTKLREDKKKAAKKKV